MIFSGQFENRKNGENSSSSVEIKCDSFNVRFDWYGDNADADDDNDANDEVFEIDADVDAFEIDADTDVFEICELNDSID